jgi:hypothetical protein
MVPAQEGDMRRIGVAAFLVLVGGATAMAAEMPTRKAGLWEVTVNLENRNVPPQTMQQCTDPTTDQALQSNAGPATAPRTCSKRDVSRSGNSVTIDSVCTAGGRTLTSHTVMTGNFDSAYTMTVTSQVEGVPGGPRTTNMSAKWLGPCAADQKPGDVVMGGRKFNINAARTGVPPAGFTPPGAPGAPPR